MQPQDQTRKIGTSLVTFWYPMILVCALSVIMIWEIVRTNLTSSRGSGVWDFTILDRQSAANLLAVAMGLTFARAQYARAVRPLIGWSATPRENDYGMTSRHIWYVEMANGGTHNVAVNEVHYRLGYRNATQSQWVGHYTAVQLLENHGLQIGTDFDLNTIGQGAVLGSVYIGRFSEKATREIGDVELRVRVTDAVGDRHERTLHCLRGAETELRSASASG
ncbi:hypothetical protein AB0D12_03785 [Streptomyces sp. NPDC048479]|uniref:hypothetical protein n=1 Tax=unclassified Streptomyces TaxID=2593676 RepID=UPI00341A7AFD